MDKQLAEYILEQHKPAIFVVNKWDLMKADADGARSATTSQATFPSLDYVPIAFITAKTGKNVQRGAEPGAEPAQAGQRPRRAPAT